LIAITAITKFAKLAFRQSHPEQSGLAGGQVAAKPDGHFNLKKSFCCRFAADAATADR
jgi:hypothetical protein